MSCVRVPSTFATGSTSCRRSWRGNVSTLHCRGWRRASTLHAPTAAEAGDNVEERMARAEASLEEVNEKWARVQALVTDRCN